MNKWTQNYLDLAKSISQWSKDPSSKIGAVVVGDHGQLLAQGYNGFPRGVKDLSSRLNDREQKYSLTVHAEMNCIYNSSLNGISLNGGTMYVHGLPVCHVCSIGIIQVGIKKVIERYDPNKKIGVWAESSMLAKNLFRESGVQVISLDFDGNII